jgi:hypothetical protein
MVLVALALAIVAPMGADATSSNPIFGKAKVQKLDNKAMESVIGQDSTSAYYAYLGAYYSAVANQYGSYGAYLENFGAGYQSTRNTYYYYAQNYAYYAYLYYYYAYVYN